ncbi:hypothetical protein X801_04650 [Opisthorchis viverrini]|uniref:Peptidase A1 domain-containing protein n=1 Tax=Opisthorchis viverrini TaxID=6198 RepID=A0A1S8WY85_OPIVI|nr:hypothetical protein X801_04650 [Opisthorchis viverrini]
MQIGEYRLGQFHFHLIEGMGQRPIFLDYFSGKLGLAPASEVTQETFAQSLLRLFPNDPVFTFWFRPDADGEYRRGIFSFGGVHEYRYDGDLTYFPLVLPGDPWTIQAIKISLGENILCQQDCNIRFNTGVPHFYGPRDPTDEVHRLLEVDTTLFRVGAHALNCDEADSYPPLRVQFQGHDFEWRMDELWEMKGAGRNIVCRSGIRYSSSLPGWHIGQKLMFKLFTVFDLKNSRMGIAKASRP